MRKPNDSAKFRSGKNPGQAGRASKPAGKKVASQADRTAEPRKPREGTVAWLADILVEGSPDEAHRALSTALPASGLSNASLNYNLIKPSEGVTTFRTEAIDTPEDHFRDFSPPATWRPPFSLLRVTFKNEPITTKYISHCGEEILIPISGEVEYAFLMKRKGDGLRREFVSIHDPETGLESSSGPLVVGDILRAQPSIPHYTWAFGSKPAEAWICIRDISATLASLRSRSKLGVNSREKSVSYFDEYPEHYPMFAWGIAERISHFRAEAGLEIHNLAKRFDTDRAQISRIESGAGNVSLIKLAQIGAELGFDAVEPLTRPLWGWKKESLHSAANAQSGHISASLVSGVESNWRPFLSPASLALQDGQTWERTKDSPVGGSSKDVISSWIMLKGSAFFKIEGSRDVHFLSEGCVFHAKGDCVEEIRAHTQSELIKITCRTLIGGTHPQ